MMRVHCINCEEPFDAKEADIKRGWAKTCSKKCAAIIREKVSAAMRMIIGYKRKNKSKRNKS